MDTSAGAGYGFTYHNASSLLGLSISLGVIDSIAVVLRFMTRKKQKILYWVDDWLSLAALVLTWGCAITVIVGCALHALGYPTPDIDESDPSALLMVNWAIRVTSQCEWAMNLLSTLALGLIKLSFLFFLRRIFCPDRSALSTVNITLWLFISLVAAWSITCFFGWLFICKGDFAAYWGPFATLLQKCSTAYRWLVGLAISDAVLDIVIVLLPMPLVWSLHLSTARKVAVSGVFLVGLLIVVASLVRMVLVLRSSSKSAGIDEDLYISNYIWWTMFEVGIALLGSCLISIRPLLSDLTGRYIIDSLKSRVSPSSSQKSVQRVGKKTSDPDNLSGQNSNGDLTTPTHRDDIELAKVERANGRG